MEALVFAFILAAVVTRRGWADVPFIIRGKTPPSHERRMAELKIREARANRRLAARATRRPGPARAYVSALWGHAWYAAAERRRVRWQVTDPQRADTYRRKIEAKAAGTYRGPVRRRIDWVRDLHRRARDAAAGIVDGDVVDDTDPEPDPEPPEPEPPAQEAPMPNVTSLSSREHRVRDLLDRIAEANDRGETPTKHAVVGDVPAQTRGHHYRTIDSLIARGLVTDTDPDGNAYALRVTTAGRETLHPKQVHLAKEDTMPTITAEPVGLEATDAGIKGFIANQEEGVRALEGFIASLQGQDVGPGVIQALQRAQESMQLTVGHFGDADGALQDSRNVGEAYDANKDAGDKEFVTH